MDEELFFGNYMDPLNVENISQKNHIATTKAITSNSIGRAFHGARWRKPGE